MTTFGWSPKAPEQTAFSWQNRTLAYGEFLSGIERWKRELAIHGVAPGESVAIVGDPTPNACELLFAALEYPAIVLPLASSLAAEEGGCLRTARVSAMFSFADNDTWTFQRREGETGHPMLDDLRQRGEAGLVLFTSGSTGDRKGVLWSGERFLTAARKPKRPWRTVLFLRLDHIGGLNSLLAVLGGGGTVIIPQDRHPDAVCATIEQHRAELLPTTPTFLNLLLISEAYKRYDLSSLELVTYGTEPMPQSTLLGLAEVLPHVHLKQTYGLSELGILPTRSADNRSLSLQIGNHAGLETKVVDGRLWIRSQTSMLGYLNAPSPFDAEGWYDTGDEVELDGDSLRIIGRASEMINVGGEKFHPSEVENVLLQAPNVIDATVSACDSPITGQASVATVVIAEPEDDVEIEDRLLAFCTERLENYKVPMVVEVSTGPHYSDRFKKQRQGRSGAR